MVLTSSPEKEIECEVFLERRSPLIMVDDIKELPMQPSIDSETDDYEYS